MASLGQRISSLEISDLVSLRRFQDDEDDGCNHLFGYVARLGDNCS